MLDESGTDGAEFRRNVAIGRKVLDAIRSLMNDRDLGFDVQGCCMRSCSYLF